MVGSEYPYVASGLMILGKHTVLFWLDIEVAF